MIKQNPRNSLFLLSFGGFPLYSRYLAFFAFCCPTRTRTWTDRTKIWSAAITPLDNPQTLLIKSQNHAIE